MYGITDDSIVALQLLETLKNMSLYVIVARLTKFYWLQQFLHLHMAIISRHVSLLHNFTFLYFLDFAFVRNEKNWSMFKYTVSSDNTFQGELQCHQFLG
jgi:hypothetical protein